jgi:8-oxoguanine deaminase
MILLKNCFYVATFNDKKEELTNCDILIRNNTIERIASSIDLTQEVSDNKEVIDCSHLLVMPGMINTHHHMYQNITRNLPGAQDSILFDWLQYLYPIWSHIDEEWIYYSTLLGTAELLKTGATTTTDHLYLYPRDFTGDVVGIQFDAAEKTGIRFMPSRGSMTRGKSDGGLPPDTVVQTTDEVVSDMIRVIEQYHDPSSLSMRKIVLAPCSPFSVDDSIMIETARLGKAYDLVIHTHLAETQDEEKYCLEQYGKRPLELLAEWEWLGKNTYFAHGIWFDDEEIEVLADTETGISHCPTSNMRLGSGLARITEMLEKGVRVGLGVDGSASNDSSDMLAEVRNGLLLQRVRYGPQALSARGSFNLAIQGGASLLRLTELGVIEPGMGADLVLYDMSAIQYAGALSDPLAALVFSGYNHEVAYSIVNGKIVVREGKLVGCDESEIVQKVNELTKKLSKLR